MRYSQSSILTFWLLAGGVPAVISGLVAGLAPTLYLDFGGAQDIFEPQGYTAAAFILSLQGGDAFGAGAMRIIGAVYGNLTVKKLFAAIGIVHSCFELRLLLTSFLHRSENFPNIEFSTLAFAEFWFFLAGHAVLIVAFTYGLTVRDKNIPNAA